MSLCSVSQLRFVALLAIANAANVVEGASSSQSVESANQSNVVVEHFTIAHWDFNRVQTPLSIAVWLFLVGLARVGFHQHEKLPGMFPESCLLIILGVLAGLVVYFIGGTSVPLDPDTFFLFLLPPIILEAGFFMNIRTLFDNVGTVAWYAVFGTIFNAVTIGFSLYAFSASVLGWMTIQMTMLDAMLFASLIAAVDPVAVLAVFQEIHVNEELYILVFGESLFNDAVSVVLFNVFYKLSELRQHGDIWVTDWIQAVASLLVVGVVGAAIGMVFAFTTAFITKFTTPIRVIEPLFAFLMAYLAYICAELFHFSGILAAVFCGMFMKPYVRANMSTKSYTTVKYFLKMLSSVSESIVFMLMGLATVDRKHQVDGVFIILTLVFCLLYRTLGVIVLTWVINRFRTIKLSRVDQFVMAYGGLRGAIAMSLVLLITSEVSQMNDYFVTCTIVIVYFTVFVQGITIRPLVNWLKVKKQNTGDPSMNEQLHLRVIDYLMAGVEDLAGIRGHNLLRTKIERLNVKYLEPLLIRDGLRTREQGILNVISKLNMKDALDFVSTYGSVQTYARMAGSQTERLPEITHFNGDMRSSPYADRFPEERSSNHVIKKWQQVVELASRNAQMAEALEASPLSKKETQKILQENLYKEPQYYRAHYLSTKLRLNESFYSTPKFVDLPDGTSDQIAVVTIPDDENPTGSLWFAAKPRARIFLPSASQNPHRVSRFRKNSRAERQRRMAQPTVGKRINDRKMSLQPDYDMPYIPEVAQGSNSYVTPKGSIISLPTISTRLASPTKIFATSASSATSIPVAPSSVDISQQPGHSLHTLNDSPAIQRRVHTSDAAARHSNNMEPIYVNIEDPRLSVAFPWHRESSM